MQRQDFLNRFALAQYHTVDRGIVVNGQPKGAFQPAAVLIPLIEREHGLQLLLTRRSAHLRHHASQICFPGGKCESDDRSPEQTAIREAQEEVALKPEHVTPLGRLPNYYSISRFNVTPVVALVNNAAAPTVNSDEVERVYEFPCSYLFDLRNHRFEWFKRAGHARKVFYLNCDGELIWGMTAALIQNLAQQLTVSDLIPSSTTARPISVISGQSC